MTIKRIVPCSTSTSCQSDDKSGSPGYVKTFTAYTHRERTLAWLSTPKLCAVRCEPLTLLNGHFSDSDGGADGTVEKLSVMRVWCRSLYERFDLKFVDVAFLNPVSHVCMLGHIREDPDMPSD